MPIEVVLYKKPYGHQEVIQVHNIYEEDCEWFKSVGAVLSMEETGGTFVVYADVGLRDHNGDAMEAIEVAGERNCWETFAALRKQAEEILNEP